LHAVRLFLDYLRRSGVLATAAVDPVTHDPVLIVSFCEWMRQQRGTCDDTVKKYCVDLRELLKKLGEDTAKFDAQNLRKFVLERSQGYGWSPAKRCTTAVRMFVRFLIAEGKCSAGLDMAIPTWAHWRCSSLPRYLQSDEVERVIASCAAGTHVGMRDRAILLLLARLGLRAGDIVQLRLGDIDWKEAWICVCGKGRRQTRLPMTQELGDALASYISQARHPSATDVVFIRSYAPMRPFQNENAVSAIVARAMRRAGVSSPSRGAAHVLRHSAATSMLRHGASLQEIGVILRHRSIATTEIYAKVDFAALQQIAQPWPEVTTC
jgi:site-specific recombinase XerD